MPATAWLTVPSFTVRSWPALRRMYLVSDSASSTEASIGRARRTVTHTTLRFCRRSLRHARTSALSAELPVFSYIVVARNPRTSDIAPLCFDLNPCPRIALHTRVAAAPRQAFSQSFRNPGGGACNVVGGVRDSPWEFSHPSHSTTSACVCGSLSNPRFVRPRAFSA